MKVQVVFPTPPLGETTAIVFVRVARGASRMARSSSCSRRSPSLVASVRTRSRSRDQVPSRTSRPSTTGRV